MATKSLDMQLRISGGANNNNPLLSLGGILSVNQAPIGLFDPITEPETVTGRIEYRQISVFNARATTMKNVRVWIEANTAGVTTDAEIGKGTSGMNGTEPPIATEGAVPPGVVFFLAESYDAALVIGDIPAGQKFPLWVRWKVSPGTPVVASDPVIIRIDGGYEE